MNVAIFDQHWMVIYIADFLECDEYSKLCVCSQTLKLNLSPQLDVKRPYWHLYSPEYGRTRYEYMPFPEKYRGHIIQNEYDGSEAPAVDLDSYIAAQVMLIDVGEFNFEHLKTSILKLQKLQNETFHKELSYFETVQMQSISDKYNTRHQYMQRRYF